MAKPERKSKPAARDNGQGHNSGATERAIMSCLSEIMAVDERIANLRVKRNDILNKFKENFHISKGGFNAAYADLKREGAARTSHLADYFTCIKAMGVMADLPLSESALTKLRAKAEREEAKEEKALEKDKEGPFRMGKTGEEEPPVEDVLQ